MIKFGRKFFFDRVHKKRNYKIPLIISCIVIGIIILIFIITSFFKEDKVKEVKPTISFKEKIEIEIYEQLPDIKSYIKDMKNISLNELEIVYPDNLIIEDKENTKIVSSIGEFKLTIKSEKIKNDKTVILNVVDKTAPTLTLKEVSITKGDAYKIEDFITSCEDNSKKICIFEYVTNDKNEANEVIDYSKYEDVGEYIIKIIAKDESNNQKIEETKLIINKKETSKKPIKENTCTYGNLKYSNSYVIATKIDDTKCAISKEEANSLSYEPAIEHNKKLIKEIQSAYLKNEIEKYNLNGEIIFDVTYGPVFNTANKGVVGYYIMSEAKQTVEGKTTTIARYYLDEAGNKVWKVNLLDLK